MAFGLGGLLGGGPVPDVQVPDGLPVSGGKGSPLVDAFLALQAQRLQDAVTAPQRALSGDLQIWDPATGHTTDEAQGAAAGMAGLAMTGSMPFKAPAGAIRSFGGGQSLDDLLASMGSAIDQHAASAVPDVRPMNRVDPKAASWDLYHGTDAPTDFARFDTNLPNSARGHTPSSETGGVFLSPAADEAAQYSGSIGGRPGAEAGPRVIRATVDPGKTDVFDLPHLMENDPAFVARARQTVIDDAGGRPAAGQVFDERHARMLDEFRSARDLNAQLTEMGYPATEVPQVQWGYGATGAAMQMARERGLDTAVLRGLSESNGGDQVVALTPGRVRSYYDPSHVLYSGGPAGAAAGLPALASSSDPKGSTVSAGPAPGVPSMLDGLSPEMVARLLQAAQAQPTQADPAVGSPEVPDATVSPYQPPTPPTGAPTPVNLAGYGASSLNDSPLAQALSGAPSMLGGQMTAPQMPSTPQPDRPAPAGTPPSMIGAMPPSMPTPEADAAPAPQTTGALPKPPVAQTDDEEAAAAPAARAVPLPPVRPSELSSVGALTPANSFDPLTGQPVSGSPKPVAASTPAQAPGGFDLGGALKRMNQSGLSDQLIAMGAGLLGGKTFSEGLSQALSNSLSVSQASAKGDAERAKLAREQATVAGNAAIYKKYFPNATPEEAMAGGANSAIMTELMKRGLPATETYKQETDGDGNIWQVNSVNNQRSLLKGASDEKWNQVGMPGGGTMLYNRADPTKTQVLVPGEPTRPATEEELKAYGITPGVSVKMTKDGPVAIGGGNTNVNVDLGKKAAGEADAQILKKIDTSYDKAQGAIDTLGAISRQKQALDQGIISGWGSDFRTKAQAMAEQLLGITPDEKLDPTYTFEAASKQKGAALAKAISQSGHTTNMDLNLGNSIAGGDRDKTEKALRQIIDAQEILARDTIGHHNAGVDRYVKTAPDMKDRMGWYQVDTPEVYQYGQGKPIPVADPGSAPAPQSKTIGGKTYMRGPDGHWYVGAQ